MPAASTSARVGTDFSICDQMDRGSSARLSGIRVSYRATSF